MHTTGLRGDTRYQNGVCKNLSVLCMRLVIKYLILTYSEIKLSFENVGFLDSHILYICIIILILLPCTLALSVLCM